MSATTYTDLSDHVGHTLIATVHGTPGIRAVVACMNCERDVMTVDRTSNDPMTWSEVASLSHEVQVFLFGWCGCEDGESVYDDCPSPLCENCERTLACEVCVRCHECCICESAVSDEA